MCNVTDNITMHKKWYIAVINLDVRVK
jgi:hypothetical protein